MDVLTDKKPGVVLVLTISTLADSTARVHITEKNPTKPRHEVENVLENLVSRPLEAKDRVRPSAPHRWRVCCQLPAASRSWRKASAI